MIEGSLETALTEARNAQLVVLTGAGVSAESGIPTFRGPEGYWQIGSRNYRAEELATWAAFQQMPDEVWSWYLYRRSVCGAAAPNDGHRALVDLELRFGDRFQLITQNVDGLHRRAGQQRQFPIHGDLTLMRCSAPCGTERTEIPDAVSLVWPKDRRVTAAERELLRCARCGAPARPHVLWFDESYDEPLFYFQSALAAVERAELLIVAGTSGATNLPNQIVRRAIARGIPLLVSNLDPSPFTAAAERYAAGHVLYGPSAAALRAIERHLSER